LLLDGGEGKRERERERESEWHLGLLCGREELGHGARILRRVLLGLGLHDVGNLR
jgi:hypothetical protein